MGSQSHGSRTGRQAGERAAGSRGSGDDGGDETVGPQERLAVEQETLVVTSEPTLRTREAPGSVQADSRMEPLLHSALIASSGLSLVLFLLLHLGGASLALVDPAGFERLATWLHSRPWLNAAELVLISLLLLHPLLSLRRWLLNRRQAGPRPQRRRSRRQGAVEAIVGAAGRWQSISGGVLLLFLAVHLGQLRWQRPAAGEELARLLSALSQPGWLSLYALAGVALGLHLLHGHESAHRSLGLLNHGNRPAIRWLGRLLALALGAGFALLPLALALRSGAIASPLAIG
jgi:succinate dehydrogenase / fumarate reductase cytochrome b subunit